MHNLLYQANAPKEQNVSPQNAVQMKKIELISKSI
jgi:hypothetical protein